MTFLFSAPDLNGNVNVIGFFDNTVEALSIPDNDGEGNTVTSIGEAAFRNYSSLVSVIMPTSLKSIGRLAFSDCTSLSLVTVPKSVTFIESYAFRDSAVSLVNFEHIDVLPTIAGNAFTNKSPMVANYYNNIRSGVGGRSVKQLLLTAGFSTVVPIDPPKEHYSSNIESHGILDENGNLTYPAGIKKITTYPHEKNSSIKSVIIPSSVIRISSAAFQECNLVSIEFEEPSSLTFIDDKAFAKCSKILSVVLPNSVKFIFTSAFENCGALQSITISKSIRSIDNNIFSNCTSLTTANVPMIFVPDYMFSGCTSLSYFKLSVNPIYIGKHAFSGCALISKFNIPGSVSSIGEYAFNGCTGLVYVKIPNLVRFIHEYTFADCTSLKSASIPESVEIIEEGAFSGCTSLESVTFHHRRELPSFKENAFYNTSTKIQAICYKYVKSVVDGKSREQIFLDAGFSSVLFIK